MSDLSEFLLARIAEDEEVAREASPGPWHPNAERTEVLAVDDIAVCDGFALSGPQTRATTTHIARHDPARVLAECEAKRRIVEDALADVRDARRRPGWTIPDQEVDELGRRYRAGVEHEKARQLPETLDRTERLLRLLALPYASHPDYREEWSS